MKGLFYFRLHFDDKEKLGVVAKCKAIAAACRHHGHTKDIWHYTQDGFVSAATPENSLHFNSPLKSWRHILLFYLLSDYWLWRKIDFRQYDFVYIRHLPTHLSFVCLLHLMKRQHPQLKIIVEMATFPYDDEYAGFVNKTILFIDQFFRRFFRNYVDGIAHFGNPGFILGIPAIPIRNGIDVSIIPIRKPPLSLGESLHILAIGNWSHWHALDRVMQGIANYKFSSGPISIIFTIIGNGPAKKSLVELAGSLALNDNVNFLEPLSNSNLDEYFDQAHIAIGSLGIHRINLPKATPLKHREYCARGIPFIFSTTDDDFPMHLPFVRQFSADDTAIDVAALVAYARQCYVNSSQLAADMNKFANEHLDWGVQVKPILEAIERK